MNKKSKLKIWIIMAIFILVSIVSLFFLIPNFSLPFLAMIYWLIGIVLVISFTTFIHEFGHYMVATRNGVKVYEFAIGFGPTIFKSIRENGTLFSIRLLPLGGYVSVASDYTNKKIKEIKDNFPNMTEEEKNKFLKQIENLNLDIEDFENNKTIDSISYPRKTLFAAGGVLFNFVSIFILTFVGNFMYGSKVATDGVAIPLSHEMVEIHGAKSYDIATQTFDEGISGYDNLLEVVKDDDYKEISNLLSFIITSPMDMRWYFTYNGQTYNMINSILSGDQGRLEYRLYSLEGFSRGNELSNGDSSYENETVGYLLSFEYYFKIGDVEVKADSVIASNGNLGTQFDSEYSTHLYINGYHSRLKLQVNNDRVSPILLRETGQSIRYNGFELIYVSLIDSFKVIFYSLVLTVDFFLLGVITKNTDFHFVSDGLDQHSVLSYSKWFINTSVILSALMIFFNVLPIPPLDGWKIAQYTYEGSTKKKIKRETERKISLIGWALIIGLMFLFLFI